MGYAPYGQPPTAPGPYAQFPGQAQFPQGSAAGAPYSQPAGAQAPYGLPPVGQPQYGEAGINPPRSKNRIKLIVIIAAIAIFLIGVSVAIYFIFSGGSEDALTGDVSKSQEVFAADLAEGVCIESLPAEGKVLQTIAVPCKTEHSAEVIGTVAIGEDSFPGEKAVGETLNAKCSEMAQEAIDKASVEGELFFTFFAPSKENFAAGKKSGTCLVFTADTMTGSFTGGDVELNS